jgi:hypothetical protein
MGVTTILLYHQMQAAHLRGMIPERATGTVTLEKVKINFSMRSLKVGKRPLINRVRDRNLFARTNGFENWNAFRDAVYEREGPQHYWWAAAAVWETK